MTKHPVPTSADIINSQLKAEREEVLVLFKARLLETMRKEWTFANMGVAWMITLPNKPEVEEIINATIDKEIDKELDSDDTSEELLMTLLKYLEAADLKPMEEWSDLECFLNDPIQGLLPTLQKFVDEGR